MLRYIVTLIVIVVLVAIVWLVEINQGPITVHLTPTKSLDITTASFFLLSLAFEHLLSPAHLQKLS